MAETSKRQTTFLDSLKSWVPIIILVVTLVAAAAILNNDVQDNSIKIENHEVKIQDHEKRITVNETVDSARKEQLDRIEHKLDKALGIE